LTRIRGSAVGKNIVCPHKKNKTGEDMRKDLNGINGNLIMVHVRQDEAASEDILKFQNSSLIKKIKPQCAKFNSVTTIYGFKLHQ